VKRLWAAALLSQSYDGSPVGEPRCHLGEILLFVTWYRPAIAHGSLWLKCSEKYARPGSRIYLASLGPKSFGNSASSVQDLATTIFRI
jgi:hypothetical protein